ncbi:MULTISPECIES: hypothetical protein [Pseudomonadaceae]|uniref:DUF2059 domain-containing protein n=1 Tax=Aquipseudomonas alcaligenes TaxID=43263 RepID=A0AB73HY06_AQUAC|nr:MULTISPECIES: hypothetical protein [Pseudomonas]MDH0142368.1 hypothetical protein [Pseudomonas alcaligenes]NMY42498.1 hypothetical protein [Pseudomonas sp. WS 5013]
MRLSHLLLAALLALAGPARAADNTLERVLELSGVKLLCEQTAPLLQRGMQAEQQKALGQAFAAAPLCRDLAAKVATQVKREQLDAALKLLDSPLAQHFTAAERAVGKDGGLPAYRQQLQERPPLGKRLELVQRLDKAAHTTELATLLRYEVGKTQALLVLRARGGDLDEKSLAEQTAAQLPPLRESSAKGIEAFMLYAYRQTPSEQLAEYAALYEQAPLRAVLEASAQALPEVFAARRAKLK